MALFKDFMFCVLAALDITYLLVGGLGVVSFCIRFDATIALLLIATYLFSIPVSIAVSAYVLSKS